MLALYLLGTPELVYAGQPLQLPRRKNRAVLFYLAAHLKPLTREQLLAFFFMDHERAAAQQILRTMLYDLRKQLGDSLIVQDETLALAPDAFVDTRTFETNLQSPVSNLPSLVSALSLYRGDFLEGFTLTDTPEFDDWVARERERYRGLAVRGWMQVAAHHESERAYGQALDALNHALAFDELNEQAQQHALRMQYRMGDRSAAIRRFEQLQKRLDDELGVPPMAETRAVYDAIVTDTLAPEPPTSSKRARASKTPNALLSQLLPFVGRAQELERLNAEVGSNKLICIQGEAGIGKTRLLEEFIAGQPDDTIVLRGVAHELEQNLPYQPVMEALRSLYREPAWQTIAPGLGLAPVWWAELARLTPELALLFSQLPLPAPITDEARVWQALHQLLVELSAGRRVIFLMDDLQWADSATAGLLGYLTRQPAQNLVLIAAARSVEAQTPAALLLQTLTREERLTRLEINGLTPEELKGLAAHLTKSDPAQFATWLNDNTEGNPFLINEMLRYAYDNEMLKRDGTPAPNAPALSAILTPTIQNLIRSRTTPLDDGARRVLQCACVIGREFDFGLVARAAELPEDVTLDGLDALQRGGLIRETRGAAYTFDHQLTMQFTYQELGAARQRVLHRRVATALSELSTSEPDSTAGLIAQHFSASGELERAAPFALRAGNFASSVAAWAQAIGFYELALQGERRDAVRAKIYVALGDAQFHQGTFPQATESYRQGLDRARVCGDVPIMEEALLGMTTSFFPQGRYTEAIEFARELRQAGPPGLVGAAEFAWGTTLAVESAHPFEAEAHLRAAEEFFSQRVGYPTNVTAARLTYQLAAVIGQRGDSGGAVAKYREALRLIQTDPSALDITRTIMLYNNLGYHLHLLGELAEAENSVRTGIRFAQEKGSTSHLPYMLSTLGEIALAKGNLDAAENSFTEALAAAVKTPIPERIAGSMANLGLVAKARGQNARAIELLSTALERADEVGNGHLSVRIRIWLAPLLPPAESGARLREARTIAEANGYAGLLREIEKAEA